MKPKFQADTDLKRAIIAAVKRREPMVDFQTAQAAKLEGLSDGRVLALAASENRILVSHDRRTMPFYFADFIADKTSAGLIIVSQEARVADVVEELILIWAATEAEEWVNTIVALPL